MYHTSHLSREDLDDILGTPIGYTNYKTPHPDNEYIPIYMDDSGDYYILDDDGISHITYSGFYFLTKKDYDKGWPSHKC